LAGPKGPGTRPGQLTYDEQNNLPDDGTTGVGAVCQQIRDARGISSGAAGGWPLISNLGHARGGEGNH
jgi:hypothetical protein